MDFNKEEKKLLGKLYECQEMMEKLPAPEKSDKEYEMMCKIIERLEKHIIEGSNNVGI